MSEEQKKPSTPQDDEAAEEAEAVIEDAQGVVDEGGERRQQGDAKPMADDSDEVTGATTDAAADATTDAAAEAGEGAEKADAEAGGAEIVEQLRAELVEAQAKADEYLDRLQRTAADFQNTRRRIENQLNEEVERANAALIMRLLPVLDDLDLAFQNVPESARSGEEGQENNGWEAAWLEGFAQIRKKLLGVLADEGVTPVPTDGAFDPHLHDAISSEPSDTVESGHIIEVLRAGYDYKGRVLRPALVRVAM